VWNDSPASVLGIEWRSPINIMPRYFFHMREGRDIARDAEGQEHSDAEAARREAINTVREIISEKLLHGGALNHCSIEIADETGHVVDVINSREVLLKDGGLRTYADDIVQSAPTKSPPK
jgi:hypothetical protein